MNLGKLLENSEEAVFELYEQYGSNAPSIMKKALFEVNQILIRSKYFTASGDDYQESVLIKLEKMYHFFDQLESEQIEETVQKTITNEEIKPRENINDLKDKVLNTPLEKPKNEFINPKKASVEKTSIIDEEKTDKEEVKEFQLAD